MRAPTISIKPVTHAKYNFVVNVSLGKKRNRHHCLIEGEAKDFAQRESVRIQNEGVDAVFDVTQADRSAVIEAKPVLDMHGKTIRDALRHYLEHLAATASSCRTNSSADSSSGR